MNIKAIRSLFKVKDLPESVYFYTLHKCASTLFSSYVLKKAQKLEHVDYAQEIYNGKLPKEFVFHQQGYIYGPIRVTKRLPGLNQLPNHDERSLTLKLVGLTTEPSFIKDKTAIFLIRDPRDILVSRYYSFGHSHSFSPVESIRKFQEQRKKTDSQQTIDSYALKYAEKLLGSLEIISGLSDSCKQGIVLKYEDMIQHWDHFAAGLTSHLKFDANVLKEIYHRSRPVESEDIYQHRRSGKSRQFEEKLKPETVSYLNEIFNVVLERFGYEL
ncbi:MAG: hypothetical protein AAGH78_07645 [Cyanobacteria bacterium P01_H01_bin.58]